MRQSQSSLPANTCDGIWILNILTWPDNPGLSSWLKAFQGRIFSLSLGWIESGPRLLPLVTEHPVNISYRDICNQDGSMCWHEYHAHGIFLQAVSTKSFNELFQARFIKIPEELKSLINSLNREEGDLPAYVNSSPWDGLDTQSWHSLRGKLDEFLEVASMGNCKAEK